MSDQIDHYDDSFIRFLEWMWGTGYLSPGGQQEVERIFTGIETAGKTILDIGCGSGGITVSLAKDFDAAKVIGIDVEAPVCDYARTRADEAGCALTVEIRQVEPGRLPLTDNSIDIVFSKDSIVHIPDKKTLTQDVFRVLKSGGWFVASDWLIGHDHQPSAEMRHYLAMEDLDFGMASPEKYRLALENAGFVDVQLFNRNAWYNEVAMQELQRLVGPEKDGAIEILGEDGYQHQVKLWQEMLVVLGTGEHCPHHFRGRKP